ncbi:MAG: GNAT family N-acetyltransferase [Sphaerochaetaceae bacterium]
MADMLVKLYDLPSSEGIRKELASKGIVIHRALPPDKERIVEWIRTHSTRYAGGEADVCFSHTPVSLFLATRECEILGYCCYDATAPDFFGPTKVLETEQGKGIGKALLLVALEALAAEGYGYAIIGGVGPVAFYAKCCNAILIEGSTPGLYKDFIRG